MVRALRWKEAVQDALVLACLVALLLLIPATQPVRAAPLERCRPVMVGEMVSLWGVIPARIVQIRKSSVTIEVGFGMVWVVPAGHVGLVAGAGWRGQEVGKC